jgi:hypothetical protein
LSLSHARGVLTFRSGPADEEDCRLLGREFTFD